MVVELAPAPALMVFVGGRAKTKGSMTLRPNGTAAQSVVGSTRWAELMASAVAQEWRDREPLTGPLWIGITFILAGDPVAPRAGDCDKLTRNVWDALQPHVPRCPRTCRKHAGVVADDVLFVQSCESKRRSLGVHDPIGVHIALGPMP